MYELVYTAASGVIGALSGVIGSYVILKHNMRSEKIYAIIEDITDEIRQDTAMQQKIYGIMALAGQGFIAGSGIKGMLPGKGGKFNIESLIGMGAQAIFGKMFSGQAQTQESNPNNAGIGLAKTTG